MIDTYGTHVPAKGCKVQLDSRRTGQTGLLRFQVASG